MNTNDIGKNTLLLLVGLLVAGCFLGRARVADHKVFADDGDMLRSAAPISFAVVGNTRPAIPALDKKAGRVTHEGATRQIVEDIARQSAGLTFLVHMGDAVANARSASYKVQDELFKGLLEGSTLGPSGQRRIAVVPVAGECEYRGDRLLESFGVAYTGVGADIGFNRVGTWSAFDLEVKGHRWRFLVLDSNKKALGPRWKEQLYWIPKAVAGDGFDSLVVFLHHPERTLAQGRVADPGGAASELIGLVEDSIGLMKLRAVFTGDPSATEVFMVGGRYGTLHFNAGGGGAPADRLARWAVVRNRANKEEVYKLETVFDVGLLKAFNKRALEKQFPEKVIDEGRGDGSFKGFPGVFDARWFPVYGWWAVTLDGPNLTASFRLWNPDGSLHDAYQVDYQGDTGWRIGD